MNSLAPYYAPQPTIDPVGELDVFWGLHCVCSSCYSTMCSVPRIWHGAAESWVSGSDETQALKWGRFLLRDVLHGSIAKLCKLDWIKSYDSILDVADLAKHCPNRPVRTSKDLPICMKIPYVGLRLKRLVSNCVAIIKHLAWTNSFMVPQPSNVQGCQLRPGYASKIQRFTLAYHVFNWTY